MAVAKKTAKETISRVRAALPSLLVMSPRI
jgi:hypothetical protein